MTAVCLSPGRSSRGWGGSAREGRLVLFNCVCCSNTIISPCDSLIGWLHSGCERPLASVHRSAFITGDCLCPPKPSDALMTHYRSILLRFCVHCGLPQCIGDIYCCLEKLRKPFFFSSPWVCALLLAPYGNLEKVTSGHLLRRFTLL